MIASPNDLIDFIELSNTLNFSRASERIGISQPSLSTAIKRLEQAIGAELFIRGKNGVSLTQAGKRLLSHGELSTGLRKANASFDIKATKLAFTGG